MVRPHDSSPAAGVEGARRTAQANNAARMEQSARIRNSANFQEKAAAEARHVRGKKDATSLKVATPDLVGDKTGVYGITNSFVGGKKRSKSLKKSLKKISKKFSKKSKLLKNKKM